MEKLTRSTAINQFHKFSEDIVYPSRPRTVTVFVCTIITVTIPSSQLAIARYEDLCMNFKCHALSSCMYTTCRASTSTTDSGISFIASEAVSGDSDVWRAVKSLTSAPCMIEHKSGFCNWLVLLVTYLSMIALVM